MSTTIYGIGTNSITPQPDFRAKKDATGKWSATQSYTIKRGDYAAVASLFNKGELIAGVYPQVQAFFATLIIEDHEYNERPGALSPSSGTNHDGARCVGQHRAGPLNRTHG